MMVDWIKGQVVQPSTARGLVLLAAALGLSAEAQTLVGAVLNGLVAAVGLWDVVRRGRAWTEPGA